MTLREEYEQYMTFAKCCLNTLETIVCNLQALAELDKERGYNPYHVISSRSKKYESAMEKCERKHVKKSMDVIKTRFHDLIGIRIVTLFLDDVRKIRDEILRQPGIVLVEELDYISNPKENGYRSLHLKVLLTLYSGKVTVQVPAEIQIRTIFQDSLWSVEHVIKYKKDVDAELATHIGRQIAVLASEQYEFECQLVRLRDIGAISASDVATMATAAK